MLSATDPCFILGNVDQPGRRISLLFDLFVLNQHTRRLLGAALAETELRADEYAVYSLLFEQGPLTATEMGRRLGTPLTTLLDYLHSMEARGHLRREPHPRDGRARRLSLTLAGATAQRQTNEAWEVMRIRLEAALRVPQATIREALQALDDAVLKSLEEAEEQSESGGSPRGA